MVKRQKKKNCRRTSAKFTIGIGPVKTPQIPEDIEVSCQLNAAADSISAKFIASSKSFHNYLNRFSELNYVQLNLVN